MEFSIGQVSVVGAYDLEPELVASLSPSPAVWPEGWQPTLCVLQKPADHPCLMGQAPGESC